MDRWGRKYDHGMLKLTWKARLRSDKRMPKMDTDLLLKDADTKEQFETTLAQHLTVADSTKESMTIDEQWSELKEALTTVAQAVVPKAPKHYRRQKQLSLEIRALIDEPQCRYPKMDKQERIEMQKKINQATQNDWCRYIEKVVTEMELADSKGDARKVHNLAKLPGERKVDKNIDIKCINAGELMTSEGEVLNKWTKLVEKKFKGPDLPELPKVESKHDYGQPKG